MLIAYIAWGDFDSFYNVLTLNQYLKRIDLIHEKLGF